MLRLFALSLVLSSGCYEAAAPVSHDASTPDASTDAGVRTCAEWGYNDETPEDLFCARWVP